MCSNFHHCESVRARAQTGLKPLADNFTVSLWKFKEFLSVEGVFALLISSCQLCQKRKKRKKKKKQRHTHTQKNLEPNFYFSPLYLFVCKVYCCAVSTEVLLDMKATGGELGWLTWPLDQGDKPGVSPPPSFLHLHLPPPAPTFPLGICL